MFGDAEAYERFMGRWSRQLAPILIDFANVPEAGHVLDIGSGTGSLAFSIARERKHCMVTGIDRSDVYIAFAESRNPFPDRLSFQVGDARQMPFPDAMFDANLSMLVFNFIPEPAKVLRETIRVTRPGGCISAAVWDYREEMKMLRVFWDAVATVDPGAARSDEREMPLCRAGELAELWTKGGLEQVTESPLDITMQFASFADYWDPFLLGQGPAGAYLQKADDERRDAIRRELKRRLALQSENTPFSLPARALAVRGMVP